MSRRKQRTDAAGPTPANRLASLFAPIDNSSLVFFRVYFGAMLLWEVASLHSGGLLTSIYVTPTFHFTYHGFSWVRPWPGDGMYLHFAALALLSLFVMVGFLYRLSALLLCAGFTYVFLLEKAVYLNHFYLIALFCFVLILLPAQRAFSVDALLRPSLRSNVAPAWTLWFLRFHVALPYVFGGLAKLNADWLQGQPMQLWLSMSVWRVLLGEMAAERWFALLFSWGGLLFDLAIVPLLLWRRTRLLAFAATVVFHLMNAFMFDIGVFPWLMIGASTVFFDPDWPRHVITSRGAARASKLSSPAPAKAATPSSLPPATTAPSPRIQALIAGLLLAYVLVHVLLPFRCWLYPGNVLWTEEGAFFSWRMMLRAKVTALNVVVTDVATGRTAPAPIARWLTPQQIESMGRDPEMMREFAEFLRLEHEKSGRDVEVRVLALCSLNGRRPQLILDPSVDLSRQPRTLLHQAHILPLREPLPEQPWNVPVADWIKHVPLP